MSKAPRTRQPQSVAPPPRSNRVRPVADLLPDIGGAAFRRFGFVQSAVVSRWGEIVGERYARVSSPESIRFPHGKRADGTLTLTVAGAHGPMMQHIAPEIVERVNRFFGYAAVARIVIRAGELRRPRARATPRPAAPPLPAELGDSLRDIADPELKAVLEALASGLAEPKSIPVLGKVR
ncbi:DUF721 domain-containing protein [Sphingomonas baiyangensis]|uniref:DUF721 domain-containing protein n=1 Tax=Sphingomonas baiyangensis TaxID=2572576 RepID=A0A4U1L8H9_9SPHN|nr:DUF721 domain-containing protein [Sphingomonas baiyangensis]TKD53269.1 DUF721 domain-containing protein [Sphingomonas baiyangensis]